MNKTKTPAGFQPKVVPAPQLTEEQKKIKVMQYLQQKREQFSINILCNLCQGDPAAKEDTLVDKAVSMADKLMDKLYPLPENENPNN